MNMTRFLLYLILSLSLPAYGNDKAVEDTHEMFMSIRFSLIQDMNEFCDLNDEENIEVFRSARKVLCSGDFGSQFFDRNLTAKDLVKKSALFHDEALSVLKKAVEVNGNHVILLTSIISRLKVYHFAASTLAE